MKRFYRLAATLIALMMVATLLPVSVLAAEAYKGIVGENEYFEILRTSDDVIKKAQIERGSLPGMNLVYDEETVCLGGVPTKAGSYELFIVVDTQYRGRREFTAIVTIEPAPVKSGTPKVTKNPTNETVVEGGSAVFIAKADNVRQYVWEIAIADASLTCDEVAAYIGKGLTVSGANSEKLILTNIPKELNGAYVWCRFVGAEESVDSNYAIITVTPKEKATPVITKHPTDETVEECGEAIFVAKADYAMTHKWELVAPNGTVYPCDTAPNIFTGLQISGADTQRLVLKNIPLSLDGYRVQCVFTAGKSVTSKTATIHVTKAATVSPTPTATATPTPTVAPTPPPTSDNNLTPAPTPTAAPAVTPAPTEQSNDNTLLIVTIISAAAVAIAAIAGFVILKLNKQNTNEEE